MYSRQYSVKINGVTPLLMHNDNISWTDKIKKWEKEPGNKKMSSAGDDRTPAWKWIGNLYTDAGYVCLPSDNLMTMLREGGAKCPTGNRSETYKRHTQSGIVIDSVSWPIVSSKGKITAAAIESLIENTNFTEHEEAVSELGFSLFVKRAKIGQNKHIRVRPRFDVWSCEGTLTVLNEQITTEVLQNIINFAGVYAGIGDWRPSSPRSPGSWGKFVNEITEI